MIRRAWSAIDDYHGGDGAVAVPFCMLMIASEDRGSHHPEQHPQCEPRPAAPHPRQVLQTCQHYVEDHRLNTTLTTAQSRDAAAALLGRIDAALAQGSDRHG
jgi:hypothetical protein